jgi:hypothetical protein
MSDQQVDIQITTTADTTGAKQTAAALKEVKAEQQNLAQYNKDSAAPAMETYTKATKESREETSKWAVTKKQAKDALQGFAAQFPGIAAAARLFLSPITLGFAGIGLAIGVMREKLKAAETDFASAKWGPEKVNAAAEAYERAAAAIGAMKSNAGELNAQLAAINTHYANLNKLTEGSPITAKRQADARSRATSGRVAELRIQAQNLRRQAAAAGDVPTEERDKSVMGGLEPDAQRAQQEIARLDAEIQRIEDATAPAASAADRARQIPERIALGVKYGAMTSPEEMVKALQNERSGWQGMIERRDKFQGQTETNVARRRFVSESTSKAAQLEAEAASLESGRRRDDVNAEVNFGLAMNQRGLGVTVTPQGNGYSISPEAAKEIQQLRADAAAMKVSMETLTSVMTTFGAMVDRIQAQQKNRKD